VAAQGQKAAKPSSRAPSASGSASEQGPRYDPDNVTAISQYMESLVSGNEKYEKKDFTGAIDTYKKAIQLNPKNPLGPYLLGEAYLATNNLPEAEAAFKQAVEVSDSRNQILRSHVLFALADCYEREKKWELARTAWQAYADHTSKVPDGGAFPQTAAARIKVIDEWVKLDKAYQGVRERIAAEKSDAGKPPAAPPAAPPAKK